METNKKNIPGIRFPEFMNDGEWLSAPLYELIEIITPTNKLQTSEYKPSGKYPIIDQSQKYIVAYSDSAEALTNTGCSDTIVFGDHTCALKFVNFPFIQGADGIKIFKSKDNNKILTDYLYQYLSAFPIESKEYKRHFSELKETLIKFPSDAIEQKRIAECMESLERYTIQTKVKLEQLKAHKKGLMQKLFPAPGKSVPECRFKEFENDGEWEQLYIKDIFEFIPNNTLSRAELNYNIGNVKNIHYGDILTSFNEYLNTQKETIPFVTNLNLSEKLKRVKLNNGDIVIADTAEDETAGKCTEITNMQHIDTIVSGLHTIALHPTTKFATGFLGFFMNSESFRHQLLPLMQGVKVLSLSKKAIASCNIYYPMSFLEQKRIAECLTSLNDQICLYNDKLDILERHKQALRQRLFPTI